MSEARPVFFEPTFNRSVKVRSMDDRITSDGGAVLLREVDHRLGLIESVGVGLLDPRDPRLIRYSLTELLRERIFAQTLGYRCADDLDLLAHDPALRMAVWDRPGDQVLEERLASQPTQSRLIDILSGRKKNLESLRRALADWTARHLRATGKGHAVQRGTLDVDGLPVYSYGKQEGAVYNAYYGEQVYYPLVAAFSPQGDFDSKRLGDGFVHAMLRKGNAGGAQGAVRFIRNAVKKCSAMAKGVDVRFDAAFAIGEVMDALTHDGVRFVGRLKTNTVLDRLAYPHIQRPVGRPPQEGYEYTVELGPYQATPWAFPQRLVLVVVDKPDSKTGQLLLFPEHFFLITSWREKDMNAEELLGHYRRRGTFEDRLGELSATVSASLSSPKFVENEALFLISLLSFNLGSMLRGELEAQTGNGWDLKRLQTSVLKAGGRVVKTARRLVLDLAHAVVPLWAILLWRIEQWTLPELWKQPLGPQQRPWMPPPRHAHRVAILRH